MHCHSISFAPKMTLILILYRFHQISTFQPSGVCNEVGNVRSLSSWVRALHDMVGLLRQTKINAPTVSNIALYVLCIVLYCVLQYPTVKLTVAAQRNVSHQPATMERRLSASDTKGPWVVRAIWPLDHAWVSMERLGSTLVTQVHENHTYNILQSDILIK